MIKDRPLKVYDLPPDQLAEWDKVDDRRSCQACRNRSGNLCVTFKRSHVPVDLVHRCEAFSARIK